MTETGLQTCYFDELEVGQFETLEKVVTEADIAAFAAVSGDNNPVHLDEEFAKGTFFKTRIAHGMLSASYISAIIGTRLPGQGTIYMQQDLQFMAPVKLGDTLIAKVEVLELIEKGGRARLGTTCLVDDKIVLQGTAMVKAPRRKS